MIRYERIYPPDYSSKDDPRCPECGDRMFYVGRTSEICKGKMVTQPLYQCRECRRLYQEIRE